MKKLLLATTLCAAFTAAHAIPVVDADILVYSSFEGAASTPSTGVDFKFSGKNLNKAIQGGNGNTGPFTTSNYWGKKGGSLVVDYAPADLTFTYLGKEGGHKNSFTYDEAGDNTINFYTDNIGSDPKTDKWAEFTVGMSEQGSLELKFVDHYKVGLTAQSGYAEYNPNNFKFGFLDVTTIDFGTGAGQFDWLITFNDLGTDADYNDMVVGVKAVSAIPEPETYALMLAGLGVVGFMARRRRQV